MIQMCWCAVGWENFYSLRPLCKTSSTSPLALDRACCSEEGEKAPKVRVFVSTCARARSNCAQTERAWKFSSGAARRIWANECSFAVAVLQWNSSDSLVASCLVLFKRTNSALARSRSKPKQVHTFSSTRLLRGLWHRMHQQTRARACEMARVFKTYSPLHK